MPTTPKKKPNWMKGRGPKDMEAVVPASVKTRVSEEEAGAATTKVPRTPPVATKSGPDPELATRFADFFIANIRGNSGTYPKSAADLAREAGVSSTYVRFQVARPDVIARVKSETGVAMTFDRGTISLDGVPAPAGSPGTGTPVGGVGRSGGPTRPIVRPTTSVPEEEADPDYFYYPPGFVEHVKAIMAADLNVWFHGETGTGKSEGFERICETEAKATFKVSCNGESSVDDVLGHYVLRGTETVWIDGALPLAMKAGAVLICEEVDAAPAEVNLALQRALEVRHGNHRHFLNPRNGEEVVAAPGFSIAATANTTGGGDFSGLYAGTQTQNAAFRDRFVFMQVTYPSEPAEIKILQKRISGLPFDIARKAVQLARHARDSVKNGLIFTPVSTRSLLAFGQLYMAFKVGGIPEKAATKDALNATIFHKAASPSDAKALSEMAQRIFGTL
jgi:cobaltochelatase CobS